MDYYSISKIGDSEINEDYTEVFDVENRHIFVLADGLGGHGFGEVASKEAVSCIRKTFEKNADLELRAALSTAFENANDRLRELQHNSGEMSSYKTTLVVLVIEKNEFIWGHIGDSRFYHFENGILIERSMDHSVPQMLVNAGKIKEKQIRHHEDRSKLLKAVGDSRETFSPLIGRKQPVGSDSSFLLCSDGFWENIDERHMQKSLKRAKNPEDWINEMTKIVEKNGKKYKMDNYSAICIKV